LARLALDYLWFDSLGYASVFLVKYKMSILMLVVFTILAAFILFLILQSGIKTLLKIGGSITSLWDQEFFTGQPKEYIEMETKGDLAEGVKAAKMPALILIIMISVIQGLAASGSWLNVLMYLNRNFNNHDLSDTGTGGLRLMAECPDVPEPETFWHS